MELSNNKNSQTPWAVRTHEEMKDVLMSPGGDGPAMHYYMIRGGSDKRNITVLESGDVDGEFIKTYGHYHVDDLGEIYTVLSGEGIMLLQSRVLLPDGTYSSSEIDSVKALYIREGSVINIPPKVGHLIINTGDKWLVTSDDSPVAMTEEERTSWPVHADYQSVKDFHGFAYYVVKDGSEISFVKNEAYKNVPDISFEYA